MGRLTEADINRFNKYLLFGNTHASRPNSSICQSKYLPYDHFSSRKDDLKKYLFYDGSEASRPSLNKDVKHLYLKYKNKYLILNKFLNRN